MKTENDGEKIKELYDFCVNNGIPEDRFLSDGNLDRYIETSIDAYRNYPMFMYVFNGVYDKDTLERMLKVDFKSRMKKMLGISNGNYESVILVEPPMAKRTGLMQYIKAADRSSYSLLLKAATYRQDTYEKYALKKRKPYVDEKTWYIYIFATKKSLQRMGYGKKLMKAVVGFANANGYRLCLETNASENVTMYERFGFKLMDSTIFKKRIWHYVMLYDGERRSD
jgi:ribosomal protein S18 acetylase RimI-like enzyme